MKAHRCLFTVLLISSIACHQDSRETALMLPVDSSTPVIVSLGQMEARTWEFFHELEAEIRRRETRISENEINAQIQFMIDNGLVEKPHLWLETATGTEL